MKKDGEESNFLAVFFVALLFIFPYGNILPQIIYIGLFYYRTGIKLDF